PEPLRTLLRERWRLAGEPTSGAVFPVRRGKRAGELKAHRGISYAKALRRDLKIAFGARYRDEAGRWKEKTPAELTPRERELFLETEATRPVDFHSFRRAFNTALADAGVNVQTAMRLAGHADAATHMR